MRTGTATAGELAEAAGLTGEAATRMIDRLAESGWVVRSTDEDDRRTALVTLRKQQRSRVGELYAGMSAGWSEALADRSDAELELALELLEQIHEVARAQAEALRG